MSSPAPDKRAVFAYAKRLLSPYWRRAAINFSFVTVGSFIFLVPPVMTKYIMEQVLPQRDISLLLLVCLCLAAVPVVGSALIIVETYVGRFMLKVSAEGRGDLYNGVQHRPLDWFRRSRTGDLLARMLDDTRGVTDFADKKPLWFVWLTVTIIVGFGVLFSMHAGLAAVISALWAAHAVMIAKLGKLVKRREADMARHTSGITETLREIVTGAHFIKASGLEKRALDSIRISLDREWELTRRSSLTNHAVDFAGNALSAAFLVVLYGGGGWLVLRGEMTAGELVAFVAVYNWLKPFGISMFDTWFAAQRVVPAVKRIAEVAFPAGSGQGIVPADRPLAIEVRDVSYRYEGVESAPAVSGVGFDLAAGSVVSIVGLRGSGKSTLTDLLLGLKEPSSGQIRIGGVPLGEADRAWLRKHLVGVTQDIALRSGTVLDNIVYGTGNSDSEAVKRALRMAELEPWIDGLPDGLLTQVGEQGMAISGGERQRIGIARALLRTPSVLLLDEATSALDPATERRLLGRLAEELARTTVVLVTHRLSAARHSDRILVMHEGNLAESGTYEELYEAGGIFRRLCDRADLPV